MLEMGRSWCTTSRQSAARSACLVTPMTVSPVHFRHVKGHSCADGPSVNAVCFADESSTNILVSGSDDGYVKVWDRRSLSSSTPSGVLVGATEGITYTAPKGDGRYIVVNSKDQAARLYDLRKMRSHSEFDGEPDAVARYGQPRYDCECDFPLRHCVLVLSFCQSNGTWR